MLPRIFHYCSFEIDRSPIGGLPVLHGSALCGGARRRGNDQPRHETNVRRQPSSMSRDYVVCSFAMDLSARSLSCLAIGEPNVSLINCFLSLPATVLVPLRQGSRFTFYALKFKTGASDTGPRMCGRYGERVLTAPSSSNLLRSGSSYYLALHRGSYLEAHWLLLRTCSAISLDVQAP